jgi:hypothetical protein
MEVVAVSIVNGTWRWRIVDGNGTIVAESDRTFPDIAIALAFGRRRVQELEPPPRRRYRPPRGPLR